jgi:hypothetical protein
LWGYPWDHLTSFIGRFDNGLWRFQRDCDGYASGQFRRGEMAAYRVVPPS